MPEETKALFHKTFDTGIEHGTITVLLGKDAFEVTTIFTKLLSTIKLDTVINGFTFGKVIGGMRPIGTWTYNEYIVFIVIVMTIIKVVYRVKISILCYNGIVACIYSTNCFIKSSSYVNCVKAFINFN